MGRREENKLDKRRRIDAAGLQELLAAGYTAATVERIAERADVARGTFYLYYADKHALFADVVGRFYTPLIQAIAGARDALTAGADPPTIYQTLGAALAATVAGDPDGARLVLRELRGAGPGGDAVRQWSAQVDALTADILADAVARGLLRPHDTATVALAISGSVERLAWSWLQGEAPRDPVAATLELIGLFTFGLAASAP